MITSPHPVVFDHDLSGIDQLIKNHSKTGRVFVLCDSNTRTHCLPRLLQKISGGPELMILEIPAGEESKTLANIEHLCQQLNNLHADRNSVLVNLGGGVVCDIGGFTASIYKRGIQYIHIPTSLLAQVDAAIGGKNGVNVGHIKNQIGTISFPTSVIISAKFLTTLPESEFRSGLAEVYKHGLIASKDYWNEISNHPNGDIGKIIEKSVQIKSEIVSQDPHERGLRKILNLGHTVGHAIESYVIDTGNKITHGEAVVAGILVENFISAKSGLLSEEDRKKIEGVLLAKFGKIQESWLKKEELILRMHHDKKNKDGKISFSLLREIGKAGYDDLCDESLVAESLQYYQNV